MKALVITRPPQIRVAAMLTLVVIVSWAAVNADLSDFGVLAYPAIVALQTVREWSWRLEVTTRGLHERQGVGAPRDIDWKAVDAVIMPDAAWWRINPVLKVEGAPNIQMTATEDVDAVIRLAQQKRKEIIGDPASISLTRSLTPWVVLLCLACLLLGAQIAGAAT
ncbi:hypothetical protein [Euzebya sp.]|uniref:hypothetical protein n=1 Tax=Euzebya sp. TaxID=1971409 RepID=UPI0035193E4D